MSQSQPQSPPSLPPGIASRYATFVSGKRSKWLVLVAWIIIVAALSPFAAKLTDVENNETETWLPGSAESLVVANLQEEFPNADTVPAVIVYHRDGGLNDADRQKVEVDRQAIAAQFPDWQPSPGIPSQDGQAILFTVPIVDFGDENVMDDTKTIRDLVGDGGDGLQVKVTGAAGFATDFVEIFNGIDTTLLLASAAVVAVLLLFTYRSPFVWLIPLLSVAFANQTATAAVYALAKHAGLTVNGQSGGILPVLVFGAGTDYALLLIARYREELRRHDDKHEAMAFALRQAGPAILASGGTVIVGLMCLLAADLNSNQSLGPVGAVGIIGALLAMLSLLPAILVVFGRRLFWPFVPRFGDVVHEGGGIWAKVGERVSHRPRRVWIGTAIVLAIFALGLTGIDTNLAQDDQFRSKPDAIVGQRLLEQSFPAGQGQPTTVIANKSERQAVEDAIRSVDTVADVRPDGETDTLVAFAVTITDPPGTEAAFATIDRLRDAVHEVPNADAKVGGADAVNLDVARANRHDRDIVIPLVLIVVFIILALLLRALVAPLVLIATVVLSFGAAFGASVVIFDRVFDFPAVEGSIPLLGFVFLVALGVDYNIFLMSRVHEESAHLGTRQGMKRGLAVTGGVITSAGIVLAATFTVLAVLPLVSLTQLGFIVAFGVLLDTLVVRSILVPAITFDLDRRIWWPSRLAHHDVSSPSGRTATAPVRQP